METRTRRVHQRRILYRQWEWRVVPCSLHEVSAALILYSVRSVFAITADRRHTAIRTHPQCTPPPLLHIPLRRRGPHTRPPRPSPLSRLGRCPSTRTKRPSTHLGAKSQHWTQRALSTDRARGIHLCGTSHRQAPRRQRRRIRCRFPTRSPMHLRKRFRRGRRGEQSRSEGRRRYRRGRRSKQRKTLPPNLFNDGRARRDRSNEVQVCRRQACATGKMRMDIL